MVSLGRGYWLLVGGALYGAAADYFVFDVDHGGLAGGDGALGGVEFDVDAAVGEGSDDGGHFGGAVADFDVGAEGLGGARRRRSSARRRR